MEAMRRGAPVDLVFQSIAGTEAANRVVWRQFARCCGKPAQAARRTEPRRSVGDNVMYFETGQGSALSANAHHGVDPQTLRSSGVCASRGNLNPLLVNTVVGFIGPEYLYDGKQILRAGLEDTFAASCWDCRWGAMSVTPIMPRRMGMTWTHLLTLLGSGGLQLYHGHAGRRRHHAGLSEYVLPRRPLPATPVLGLRPAPEFEAWMQTRQAELPGAMALLSR